MNNCNLSLIMFKSSESGDRLEELVKASELGPGLGSIPVISNKDIIINNSKRSECSRPLILKWRL